MAWLSCPYLGTSVEFTEERERHIAARHPDLYAAHWQRVAETIADPDEVRRSRRDPNTRLFTRWFVDVEGGKFVVAAIVAEEGAGRFFLSTAYLTRRLGKGVTVEWHRS